MTIRQDIQILRGVAVLMVVLFHLQVRFFESGYLGVDVFFVISGFLMAKLYDRGTAADFYARRIDRLLPAYSLTIACALAVSCFILLPADFSQLYEQAIVSVPFLSNFYFWNQSSYFEQAAFNPLLNLWSLAVEAQFYLIVPLLYPLLRKSRTAMTAVFVLTLVACIAVQTISPKTSFFLMPFRIWEFLVGAWVAWWGQDEGKTYDRTALFQLAPLVLLLAAFFFLPLRPDGQSILFGHPSLIALAVVALTGAIIHFELPKFFVHSLAGRALAGIGDYSYSIYLIHFPAIVLWNYQPFDGTILTAKDARTLVQIVLTIAVASYVSYNFVERRFARHFKATIPRILLALLIAAAASGFSSLNERQFGKEQRNIFAAWTDRSTYRCGKLFRILNPMKEICPLSAKDGNRRLLLVGNSYADSIKTSFAKVAAARGVDLYFVVENDPLIGGRLNAARTIQVADKSRIDFIAIHFSNIYDSANNREQVSSLVKLARAKGMAVVVIAPVPAYDESVPKAMYEATSHGHAFAFDRQHHEETISAFRHFEAELTEDGASVFDPAEVLCPPDRKCMFADSALKPYYFDAGHLTLTGATQLEPMLDAAVSKLLANQAR
jgi:peptidoglycan/LPS O-acetylase OafA/YrhL